MIALVALANLRGIRQSGRIFAVRTYVFLFSFLGMIAGGIGVFAAESRYRDDSQRTQPRWHADGYALQSISLLLLLEPLSPTAVLP